MTSITNAFQNALLADATYALNVDGLRDFTGLPLESVGEMGSDPDFDAA